MSQPTRMLLVLVVFALAAVSILGFMARRYGALLDQRSDRPVVETPAQASADDVVPGLSAQPPSEPSPEPAVAAPPPPAVSPAEEADRFVEAFIEVRRALRAVGPAGEDGDPPPDAGKVLREALDENGLDEADYLKLEKLYRAWKAGRRDPRNPILAAFERRRDEMP